MSCKVETRDGMERVTFLYRLADGPCPKSYGVNVARIAGILVGFTVHFHIKCRSEMLLLILFFLELCRNA